MKPIEGLKVSVPKGTEKISQSSASYFPPSEGPFKCANCEYFSTPNNCKLVEGKVEAEGCCNLFKKDHH